jgi:hypothetical protein
MKTKKPTPLEILTKIAQDEMHLETLETRNSGDLDFRESAVWCVRGALEAAFQAGVEHAKSK